MRLSIRLPALATVATTGLALTVTGTAAAAAVPAAALPPQRALASAGVPGGTKLWAASYRDHTQQNYGDAVVASPDGSTVYVTGTSDIAHTTTVAYSAATGARRWVARYYGLGDSEPFSMAISPDGSKLFIGGLTSPPGAALPNRFAIVAMDAGTGAKLWAQHPFRAGGIATSVTVSPDGSTVYVTGVIGNRSGTGAFVVTFAYDAATGARKWLASYHGNITSDSAWVAASPDGHEVFVSTPVTGSSGTKYLATLAYDAATGAPLWTRLTQGTASAPEGLGIGRDIAVSPDSSAVFITGYVAGVSGGSSFVTVAYDPATGTRLWERRYQGPGGTSVANAITVSPDGQAVFVTGNSNGTSIGQYTTVGYATANGALLWARSYEPPAAALLRIGAIAVGVSADSGLVFITGGTPGAARNSLNFTTLAYRADTGATAWLARYRGRRDYGAASALAVGPTGQVFVTGYLGVHDGCCNFGTVAYQP